tara:strand:- start:98 stop:349 length:252 start_codon:yes stop_codon:yes gene_type:complete
MEKIPGSIMKAVEEVLADTECEACDALGFSVTEQPKLRTTGEAGVPPVWVFKAVCNVCASPCEIELIHKTEKKNWRDLGKGEA